MHTLTTSFCSVALYFRKIRGAVPFALLTGFASLAWTQSAHQAQAPSTVLPKTPAPSTRATSAQPSKPAWKDLSPQQQQALKPLAGHWEALTAERKRKWLEVSKNYPSLPIAEQEKMHSRMRDWSLMGSQQRTQARLNFAETKKLSPEEKSNQWKAYQALSPEEKRKLAAQTPAKPVGAAVVKPVPPQKLTSIQITRNTPKTEEPASPARAIQRNTLLPRPPVLPAPAVAPTTTEPSPVESDSDE